MGSMNFCSYCWRRTCIFLVQVLKLLQQAAGVYILVYILCSSSTCFSPVCLGVKRPCCTKVCSLREKERRPSCLFLVNQGQPFPAAESTGQVHHRCWCIVSVQVSELDKIHPKHSRTAGLQRSSDLHVRVHFILSFHAWRIKHTNSSWTVRLG